MYCCCSLWHLVVLILTNHHRRAQLRVFCSHWSIVLGQAFCCDYGKVFAWISAEVTQPHHTRGNGFSACSKGRESSPGTSWKNSNVCQGPKSNRKISLEHQVPLLSTQDWQEFKALLCSISPSYFCPFLIFLNLSMSFFYVMQYQVLHSMCLFLFQIFDFGWILEAALWTHLFNRSSWK